MCCFTINERESYMSTKKFISKFSYKSKLTNFKFNSNSVVACAVYSTTNLDKVHVFDIEQMQSYMLEQVLDECDRWWLELSPNEFHDKYATLVDLDLKLIKDGVRIILALPNDNMLFIDPLNTERFINQSEWRKKLSDAKKEASLH